MIIDNLNRDDIIELLSGFIKVGIISSVDCSKGTARVAFEEDGIVSYDYQVLHTNAMNNRDFAMPDIGETVVCLALPNGIADGFILGCIYTDEAEAPENTSDKRTVIFSDGTKISYDRATHKLEVLIGGTTITADKQNIIVNAPSITLNSNVIVNGSITATGDIVGGGISLNEHTHKGDSGGTTSTPN